MSRAPKTSGEARAVAHPNIALAKYWGKADVKANLPAVPSLSLTLQGLSTRTSVRLADAGGADRLWLDGQPREGRALERVSQLLDDLWRRGGGGEGRPAAEVHSDNDFPTAAGLASSASAFAALAVAANAACGTGLSRPALSEVARRASASAARSLYGGFVQLGAAAAGCAELAAEPLVGHEHWAVRLVIAVTAAGPKKVGSTAGMIHCAATSPLYPAWVAAAPAICERVRAGVMARELDAVGAAMEQSTLAMHATAMASDPGLLYLNGVSLAVMHRVRELREQGLGAYFTADAGPHVKVLTTAPQLAAVRDAIAELPGVRRVIVAQPGRGARLIEPEDRSA